jgi:6-phosphogluconolactonase/glucosamine-6-phosphate isomerase/deaminase
MPVSYNAQQNPYLGINSLATMHGDAQSSDATPFAGPGDPGVGGTWKVTFTNHWAACPTILAGQDGYIQALMTQFLGSDAKVRKPKLAIIEPASGAQLGAMEIPTGALLGGVYAYLDAGSNLVMVDGTNALTWISHSQDGMKVWVSRRIDLTDAMKLEPKDHVVGIVPDWHGRIWVASERGVVGLIDPKRNVVRLTKLQQYSSTERIDNSISACPQGVSIITSYGIYMLGADASTSKPRIIWSHSYDRGTKQKPGQLSHGSGATATFFGPNGSDYVMLSDNADRQEKLIVYRSADGSAVGEGPLFTPGASGTENSMIGVQNSIVGACTFGYPYAQYPDTKPAYRAQVAPGMERWDVNDDASGITLKWRNNGIYSAAVPRLSTADNLIYTCERPRGPAGVLTGPVVYACAIDMDSGRVVHRQRLPRLANLLAGGDPSQMVGVIDKHGVWWQGTIGGIYRISRHGDGVSGVQGASSLPLGAAFGSVSDALGTVGDGVGAAGGGVTGAVGAVGDAVGSTVGAVGEAGAGLAADAVGALGDAAGAVGGGAGKVAGKVAGAAKLDGDQFLSATRVLLGLVQGRGYGELGHGQLGYGGLGGGELGAGGLETAAKIADGVVNPTATAQGTANHGTANHGAVNQIAANQGALPGNSEALSAGGANAASVEALLAEGIVSQCAKCPPSATLMGTFGDPSVSLRLISADESVVVSKERGRSAKFTNMPKALTIINDGNTAWKMGSEFTVRSRRLNNLGQSLSNKNIAKEYYFKAEVAPVRGTGLSPDQSAPQPQSVTPAAVGPGYGAGGQKDADRSDGAVKAADLKDAGLKFVRQEGHDSILALTADLPAGKAITVNLSWKVLRGAVERPNEKYQILALKTVDADKSSFFQAQSPEVLAAKG